MTRFSEWLIESHPRVKYLKKAWQCSAIRGGAPVKAYWTRDGYRQTDESVIAKWRCTKPAHWKFTALKRARYSKDGVLCLQHLYYRAIFGDMDETEATERLMVSTGYTTPDRTMTQQEER